MEEKTVSVKVTLSVEDYCDLRNKQTQKIRIGLSIFAIIFILAGILKNTDLTSSFDILAFIVVMLLLIVAMFFYLPVRLKKTFARQYNNNKSIQREQLFVISSDGLKVFSDMGTSSHDWNDLYAYRETKDAFDIFISETQFFHIQKKSFEDENDMSLIQKYLSNLSVYKKKKKEPVIRLKTTFIIWGCLILFSLLFLALFRH